MGVLDVVQNLHPRQLLREALLEELEGHIRDFRAVGAVERVCLLAEHQRGRVPGLPQPDALFQPLQGSGGQHARVAVQTAAEDHDGVGVSRRSPYGHGGQNPVQEGREREAAEDQEQRQHQDEHGRPCGRLTQQQEGPTGQEHRARDQWDLPVQRVPQRTCQEADGNGHDHGEDGRRNVVGHLVECGMPR